MRVGLRASFHKLALAISLVMALGHAAPARAESTSTHLDNLAKSGDFQVRTAAAIALGNAKDRTTRPNLESALSSDSHPAVRAAAAAALGAIGDPAAVPALDRASKQDDSSAVRSVAATSSQKLSGASSASVKAKVLVQLGTMKNTTGSNERDFTVALREATRVEVGRMAGVEVIPDSADLKATATQRKLPGVILDGTVSKMDAGTSGSNATMTAVVDFVIKKDSSLKGTAGANAQASAAPPAASASPATKAVFTRELQDQALTGAVQGALKGSTASLVKAGS